MFDDLGDDGNEVSEIEKRFVAGEFPDDVWGLEAAVRILGCWCPPFAEEVVVLRHEMEKGMFNFPPIFIFKAG
jgi:hypothetical protein